MPGLRNCSKKEAVFPGGKGIDAARTLRELGIPCTALGFLAGFTGDYIEQGLREAGCGTAFIRLAEGFSRINVTIHGQEESGLCGRGPEVPREAAGALLEQLDGLKSGDLLILSGNVPPTLPKDFYEKILRRLEGRGVMVMADVSGETLLRVLRYRPFLVKPNRQELEEAEGRRLFMREEVLEAGRRLREKGAENVLVSAAAEGAMLFSGDEVLHGAAPRGTALRLEGAGDAMLAGFAAGWLQTGSKREALRLGIAAGSASVLCRAGAARGEVRRLYEESVACWTE